MGERIFDKMDGGRIEYVDRVVEAGQIDWKQHPVFSGVSLKTLIGLEDSDGRFTCLLVRVEPGCEIGEHIHDDQWELHEVMDGSGKCFILEKAIDYRPGVCAVIPDGSRHRVVAGNEGLSLLAKYMPAG